jgi:hypothetical protein
MRLRSGGATSSTRSRRRRNGGCGSTSGGGFDEAAPEDRLRLKRKSPVEVEAAPRRRIKGRSESPPAHVPEVGERVPLPPPAAGVSPQQVTDDNGDEDRSDDEASVAEQGVKLFPHLPREEAAAMWVSFFNNAKTCINHYNKNNQANFAYKRARGNGFFLVMEQDGSNYYGTTT